MCHQQGGRGSDFAARRSPRPIVAHKKISTNCRIFLDRKITPNSAEGLKPAPTLGKLAIQLHGKLTRGTHRKCLVISMSEQNFTNFHQLRTTSLEKWYTQTNASILDTAPRLTAPNKIGDAVHVPRVNPRILGKA